MQKTKKSIIITGEKVHHVGYRPFLLWKVRGLGIPNHDARNVKENGIEKVIVSVEGEENQIKKFLEFVKENYPENARVSSVREAEPPERVMTVDEYQKVLDSEQHNTMIQAGLIMIDMQKQTVEMQKQTVEKLDSFHQDTVQRFDNLRDDYGRVSKDIAMAVKGIEKVVQNTEKLLEKSERDRAGFEKSMNKVANAILALAKSKYK